MLTFLMIVLFVCVVFLGFLAIKMSEDIETIETRLSLLEYELKAFENKAENARH